MFLRKLIQTGHGAPAAHATQQKSFLWSCALVAVAAVLFALPAHCLAADSDDEARTANSSASVTDAAVTDETALNETLNETKPANQPALAHPVAINGETYAHDTEPPIVAPGTSATGTFASVGALPFVGIAGEPAPAKPCFLFVPGLCDAAKNRPIVALATIQTAALIADGVTTRQYLKRGYVEIDPLTRILIGRRPTWARMAPLGTLQVLAGMWLAERMETSRHGWIRRLWWLPEVAGIAGNTVATVNNVRLR